MGDEGGFIGEVGLDRSCWGPSDWRSWMFGTQIKEGGCSVLRKMGSFLGAFVVLTIGYGAGFYFFGEVFIDGTVARRPPVPFFIAFAISNTLLIAFFAWVTQQMGSAFKAALTIVVTQFLLVDVFYVMSGNRSLMAGAASAFVYLYTWPLVALTYHVLSGGKGPRDGQTARSTRL